MSTPKALRVIIQMSEREKKIWDDIEDMMKIITCYEQTDDLLWTFDKGEFCEESLGTFYPTLEERLDFCRNLIQMIKDKKIWY
jgi:hypothetical protein